MQYNTEKVNQDDSGPIYIMHADQEVAQMSLMHYALSALSNLLLLLPPSQKGRKLLVTRSLKSRKMLERGSLKGRKLLETTSLKGSTSQKLRQRY